MNPIKKIFSIVEGRGDELAVPVLLRKILHYHQRFDIEIEAKRSLGLPGFKSEFNDHFNYACKVSKKYNASIICILDYDCDVCHDIIQDEAYFRSEAAKIRSDIRFDICLIEKEFESLFLSSENVVRSIFSDIPADTIFPKNPESIRGAKEWLANARSKNNSYKPTTHQAKITAQLDLPHLLQHSPSFQRLNQAVLNLIN